MNALYKRALLEADKIRTQLGLNMFQSINVFDSCLDLGLAVRFVDINMEGMYIKQEDGTHPTILLSSQRPLPRRCFTCAHELGHHVFNHGNRLDVLSDFENTPSNDRDELLVNLFAGALLMPVAGIQAEFAKRNWVPNNASPTQFYAISSVFGTGYQTLIVHCRANEIINEIKAKALLKFSPSKILKNLFPAGTNNSFFKIIDIFSMLPVIDLEVSNYIILPTVVEVEGAHLQKFQETEMGMAYLAVSPGIIRVASPDGSLASFIRLQNFHYSGLAENRHLEDITD